MAKFMVKISGGKIIDDPNDFKETVKQLKDGWYSFGISRPVDANIADVRAAFFAGPVKAWQRKLNESGAVQVFGNSLFYDNYMTYQLLKQLFAEKNIDTGEPLSISDAGEMKRKEMLELVKASEEGYFEYFGEVM
ncbi:MAG: hypothetical protein ACE5HX_13335, partial [bacterium]